jgi:hypothetical protein
MFYNADAATPDVATWNTAKVNSFTYMFANTENANPDVSSWTLSSDLSYMFYNAESANPDVSHCAENFFDLTETFSGSGLSKDNYDALLIALEQKAFIMWVTLGAEGVHYSDAAASAREYLVDDLEWEIFDAGEE